MGGILFSPPESDNPDDNNFVVVKYHVCKSCFWRMLTEFKCEPEKKIIRDGNHQ